MGCSSRDPADDTREERVYYCQNWRADVSALLTDDGSLIQWTKYSAYGVPFGLPGIDTDSDGDFDSTDAGNIGGTYDVREDFNLDGVADISDLLDALDKLGGFQALGWGAMSSSLTANRRGYAGYEYDPVPEAAGRHLYHVRHRVYDADLGRWTRRDPLGYYDGPSLFTYCTNAPIMATDSKALASIDVATTSLSESHWPLDFSPRVVVCCRRVKRFINTPVIHCQLELGSCPSRSTWETPAFPDRVPGKKMDNGIPCSEVTGQEILDCLTRNPYDVREDLPGCQVDGGIPGNNCQTNCRNRINKCCLTTRWSPGFISDPWLPMPEYKPGKGEPDEPWRVFPRKPWYGQ